MTGIIYKAISPNGDVYVDQTKRSLDQRKSNHKHITSKEYLLKNNISQQSLTNRFLKEFIKGNVIYKNSKFIGVI